LPSNSRTVTGMRRVLLRLGLLPVLAAALVTGAVGCGGDGQGGVRSRTWVTGVCQALTPWRTQITTLNSQAATDTGAAHNPQQTRDSLVRLLSGAQQASEQARAKVAAAGYPDVKDGQAIAARFVTALANVRDAYAKAQHSIEALPMGDSKTFYDGVETALTTLNGDYAAAGVNTTTLASADLRKDFDEVPACNPT
jgi:hypothetical protein